MTLAVFRYALCHYEYVQVSSWSQVSITRRQEEGSKIQFLCIKLKQKSHGRKNTQKQIKQKNPLLGDDFFFLVKAGEGKGCITTAFLGKCHVLMSFEVWDKSLRENRAFHTSPLLCTVVCVEQFCIFWKVVC